MVLVGADVPATAGPPGRPVAVNAAGQQVLRADGGRMTYGRGDLAHARPTERSSAAPSVAASEAEVSATSTPAYVHVWNNATYGSAIGGSGFARADLDGNGVDELVFGGSSSTFGANDFWSVQRFVGGTAGYEIVHQSRLDPQGVSSITVLPPHGSTPQRILVGTATGRLRVYRGDNRALLSDVPLAGEVIRQTLLADANNDGNIDLVVLTDSATLLLDPVTLARRAALPYGASRFAIGNVDDNASVEIVYSNGRVIHYRAGTLRVRWDNTASGFGDRVELADIDNDGKAEIIAAQSWYYLRAYDADIRSVKWEARSDLDIDAMRVADVTGDGRPEVLYGDGQWGAIHALRATDGQGLWSVPNPEHGVTDIAVLDTDGDGALELAWAAGASSTGPDFMYIHDLASKAKEWRSDDVRPPFQGVDVGDVDGDGLKELVFGSFNSMSGYGDGIVFVNKAGSFKSRWKTTPETFGGSTFTGVHAVKVADLDGDGAGEILVATDRLYDGALYVIDGRTRAIRNRWTYDSGSPLYSLHVADVDGDGRLDIVAGAGKEHTGSPGTYVYVIDKDTGAVKWRSHNLALGWEPIRQVGVANIDSDAALEIIAVTGRIHVFDGVTHENWATAGTQYQSFASRSAPTLDRVPLIAGTTSGQIVRISGNGRTESSMGSACAGVVEAMQGPRKGSLLYACEGRLGSFDIVSGASSWQTDFGDVGLGAFNTLVTWTHQGRERVALGGATRVTVFEAPGA